jgi:hypothetical protein
MRIFHTYRSKLGILTHHCGSFCKAASCTNADEEIIEDSGGNQDSLQYFHQHDLCSRKYQWKHQNIS